MGTKVGFWRTETWETTIRLKSGKSIIFIGNSRNDGTPDIGVIRGTTKEGKNLAFPLINVELIENKLIATGTKPYEYETGGGWM